MNDATISLEYLRTSVYVHPVSVGLPRDGSQTTDSSTSLICITGINNSVRFYKRAKRTARWPITVTGRHRNTSNKGQ